MGVWDYELRWRLCMSPPHPALGKSKLRVACQTWDEVLVALDGAAGQRAALMGDANCDFQDGNAEGRAWQAALDGGRVHCPGSARWVGEGPHTHALGPQGWDQEGQGYP